VPLVVHIDRLKLRMSVEGAKRPLAQANDSPGDGWEIGRAELSTDILHQISIDAIQSMPYVMRRIPVEGMIQP
jgi:hypothetical protein